MKQKISAIKIPLKPNGPAQWNLIQSDNITLTLKGTIFPENVEDATDPIFDMFVIVAFGWHQYVEGICGCGYNYHSEAFINKETEQGFNSRGEAHAFAKLHGIKSYHKKGRGNEGYGDVGAEHQTMKVVTIRELVYAPYTPYTPYTYYGVSCVREFTGK